MSLMISLQDVSKSFEQTTQSRTILDLFFRKKSAFSVKVLDTVSTDIRIGDKVSVLGKNGTGKTTLLKILAGMLPPSEGRVVVSQDVARSEIGVMLSTHLLYSKLSGFQNLEFTARLLGQPNPRASVAEAVAKWQLVTIADKPVREYSNGQRSLLAIARATLGTPKLLLLDEPHAFLDGTHNELLWDYVANSPATVFITSQNPVPIKCDRVIHL